MCADVAYTASSDRPVISKHVSREEGNAKKARTLWLVEPQERQHSRRDITQRALFLVLLPVLVVRERERGAALLAPREDERDFVGRVGRVRRARLGIDHLLRVPVVRGDEQRVSRLLARGIDRADRLVRMRDRLDGRIKDARMPDLVVVCKMWDGRFLKFKLPTMSGGAKLHMMNSCLAARTTCATFSATPCTLILGCLSYVATLGEAIRWRSSFSNWFSTPPLKKNVTCAYFSVSGCVLLYSGQRQGGA